MAWFYLAKIQYERGYYDLALQHLQNISAPLPGRYDDERLTIMALALLRLNNSKAAAELLKRNADKPNSLAYAKFNLAIAELDNGDTAAATDLLKKISTLPKQDAETAALIDRVNVLLGYHALENEEFEQAARYLNQVELHGLYSNKALLGLGWSAFGMNDYAAAMAAWNELIGRDKSDNNVLEGYLAIPYLFYQQKNYASSLDGFKKAADVYENQLALIDQFLNEKDYSELINSMLNLRTNDEIGWYWQHDVLKGPLLKSYMVGLMSSNEFQESFKNYRDLVFIKKNITKWQRSIDVYEDIIELKAAAYQILKPKAEKRLNELSANDFADKINDLKQKIAYIELDEDAMALTTSEEGDKLARLRSIDYRLSSKLDLIKGKLDHIKLIDETSKLHQKQALLEGLLKWDVITTYPQRLWSLKNNLADLEAENDKTDQLRQDIRAIIDAIPDSFDGMRQTLADIDDRLKQSHTQVLSLISQHESYLTDQIRNQLLAVKADIEIYRSQALLSVAHIYDLNLKLNEGSP